MLEPEGPFVDPIIRRELWEGETVLWWGRPDPKKTIHPEESWSRRRPPWLYPLLIGLLLLGLDLFIWLDWHRLFPTLRFNPLLLVIVPALALLLILLSRRPQKRGPGGERAPHADLKHTVYAVTDQRILVIVAAKRLEEHSYTRDQLGRIERVERPDGYGNVYFGLPRPAQGGAPPPPRAAFCGIADARAVEALLTKTFKDVGGTAHGGQQEGTQEGWGI